jgi:hypothetical protein
VNRVVHELRPEFNRCNLAETASFLNAEWEDAGADGKTSGKANRVDLHKGEGVAAKKRQ